MSKANILAAAVKFIKGNKNYPTTTDLGKVGVTRKAIEHHFGNMTVLKTKAYEQVPNVIFDLEQEIYKTLPNKSTKRFVITTAILGDKVDVKFLKNIRAYSKDLNAELIVIPTAVNLSKSGWLLDPELKNDVIITKDTMINSNVFILGIKSNAKTVDPITGLPRIGQRNGTFISASPKQRLKYVPTSVDKLPHALMSTGAITLPEYAHKGLMIDKASYMANHDHVMGAVILELDKDDTFHFRQIQADVDGTFIDLGTMYKNGKSSKVKPEAFVLGDWHSGEVDEVAAACWVGVTKALKVKRWVIHDGFSGNSISHHLVGKQLTLAKMSAHNLLDLRTELDGYKSDIAMMSKLVSEVIIVKSNHDDFLERYLNEGRYVVDPHNHRLALDLAAAFVDGKNPIRHYVGEKPNVMWLELDESYKIAGIELGAHGHIGANGSRGSINTMENAYGNVVYGHSHSAQILRGAWNTGTTTHLRLAYNKGSSSWTQTSCLVYHNSQRQLINVINGKYTTRAL